MGEVIQVRKNISKKKWGREEWIILILVGVFLLIVFMPSFEKDEQNRKEGEVMPVTEQKKYDADTYSYNQQMEKRLEEVLRSIDGIDSVKAMITYKTSEEEVVLKENSKITERTTEEDSQGGKREIDSESMEEMVCYAQVGGEKTTPYVTYTVAPKVEGVLVVVGGKNASLLRAQIVKAVQALFNVESHKVVVIKMKES